MNTNNQKYNGTPAESLSDSEYQKLVDQTIELSDILPKHNTTLGYFIEKSDGYKFFEYRKSNLLDFTLGGEYHAMICYLLDSIDRAKKLVEFGVNPETRMIQLKQIARISFKQWKLLNQSEYKHCLNYYGDDSINEPDL